MLIDTHCHLNMMIEKETALYQTEKNCLLVLEIIRQAAQNNVKKMISIGTDVLSSEHNIFLSKKFPAISCTVGIHPCDTSEYWRTDFQKIKKLAQKKTENKIVGIGESGLDFYHPGFVIERQKDVFKAHIELALEHALPLVVHTRSAIDETLTVLQNYKTEKLTGVIHCFSENYTIAQDVIAMGFMLGIGGTVTYPKNEHLREVIRKLELNKIILETDAPFLPPQTMRGKKNHPAQIATIADFIANLLAISPEEVAQRTAENTRVLFPTIT